MLGSAASAMARVVGERDSRLASAGIALALVLSGVARSFLEMASGGVGSFPMPGDNLPMLGATVAVCLAASVAPRAAGRLARTRAGRLCACALALAGVALVVASRVLPAGAAGGVLFAASVMTRTSGLVALVVLCACAGPRQVADAVAQMAWGLGLAVALDFAFLLLAPAGVAVVGLFVPVALAAVLLALPCEPGEAAPAGEPAVPAAGSGGLGGVRLVTLGLYGAVGGLASSQAHTLGSAAIAQAPSLLRSCLVNDLGLALGAALLTFGTLTLLRRGIEPFSLRYLLLPAYLVAIFLAPLLSGVLGVVVPVLMALSQALFYGLLWELPCEAPAPRRVRRLAAACGCFFGGTYAGMFLGGDLLPAMDAGDVFMIVAAVVLAALLGIELCPRLLAPHAAAPAPVAQTAPAPEPAAEAALGIDALARRASLAWGLTPRESAVLPGLLRGRSVAWVASSLTVSKNTVHTHMRNIYQKAGVHSQEELIDAAEALD